MKASVMIELTANLKSLKLSTMSRHLEHHLRQARESAVDYDEFLLSLTEIELQCRGKNRLKRRLSEAKFPLMKTLESFDYDSAPELDRRLFSALASGEYIERRRNILLVGKSGTGKTHLATGLGIEACRQGIRTRFITACGLVNELVEAQNEKVSSRVLSRYERYGLLIVDEMGYAPFSKQGVDLLFQVFA